jgi:capsular polysaccharide biosynthesis protein
MNLIRSLQSSPFAVGPDDTLLIDASFAHDCPAREIWRLPRVRRTTHLDGRVLNLGSTWATNNFAHQLLDVWPRWELVRRAGWDWKDFDHVLAPAPSFGVCAAIAERIGLPLERLHPISVGEQVNCSTLVQPTHPSGMAAGHYPHWVTDFFQGLRWLPATDSPRRLYLQRAKGARRLNNEMDLVARLRGDGFVSVDAATLGARAPGWFAGAEEIVAPHGAALAQFVFASARARVLEIFPRDYVPCHYASLAHAGGLEYAAVAGSALQGSGSTSTFSVSVDKVCRVLDRLRRRSR